MEQLFKAVGYGLCHQLPARSFFSGGYQLPVCARDTGIYLGFILSAALIGLFSRGRRPTEAPRPALLVAGVLFVGVMAADGITEYAGLRTTDNDIRLLTGLLAGYAIALMVVPMLDSQLWRRTSRARPLDSTGAVWVWFASIPVAFALLRFGMPHTGVLYPLLVTAAILATFTLIDLVFVCLAPRFERRAERPGDLVTPIVLALSLAVIEIALSALLKALVLGAL